jgi:FtsP/CotA-like multicopper oxidase with cupredoxin domain
VQKRLLTGGLRRKCRLAALIAILWVAPSALAQPPLRPEHQFDQRSLPLTLQRSEAFLEPASYVTMPGKNSLTLTVQLAENTLYVEKFPDGRTDQVRLKHRSYSGGLCGSIIRVRAGDTLDVRLVNNLPNEEPVHGSGSMVHRLNVTNLHTHGLFVSPSGRADNVYLDVRPGETFRYQFEIPEDHPAGTYWYHAHLHGSVAFQVASGMAGALIVEGALDDELKQAGIN